MKRKTTVSKQPVFEGYGFEARGMEYVVIDGRWCAFSANGTKQQYNLTVAEREWLDSLFTISTKVVA